MENQHRKITGYRELSQEEVDLMNRIKEKGRELLALQAELKGLLETQRITKLHDATHSVGGHEYNGVPYSALTGGTDECIEYRRFEDAEPLRWAAIAKTELQQGIMALVRAVAQPAGV